MRLKFNTRCPIGSIFKRIEVNGGLCYNKSQGDWSTLASLRMQTWARLINLSGSIFMPKSKEIQDKFLSWLKIAHSPATVQSYYWALKPLFDWLDGTEREIVELTGEDITKYSIYLKDTRGIKTSTLFHYLIALRAIWRWMFRNEYVRLDDSIIEIPKDLDKESYPFILPQEFEKMMSGLDEFYPDQLRNRTILSFLYFTGVRIGEMIAIDISQIDLKNKKATIKTYKRHNVFREVYWGAETNYLLEKWLTVREKILLRSKNSSNALFIAMPPAHTSGERVSKHHVQKIIRNCRYRAGIERQITAHSFRHGFGHRAIDKNINPRHLQIMLGHAKLNTTMIYMGVGEKEVENIYRTSML